MTYFYKIQSEIFKFKCSDINKLTPVIKKLLKRNNIDIFNHLKYLGFEVKMCNICKKEYNPNFDLFFNISNNNEVKISDIKWGKSTYNYEKYNKNYCYGSNKKCPGIKMNPNSSEFISKTMNISIEEALNYIKRHNKSPFYRENHKSLDDYSRSQSRGIDYYINKYGESIGHVKYESHIDSIKHSNSRMGYIEKYGKLDGLKLWNDLCKKKAITLANLQNKYGKIDGSTKYNNWITSCSISDIEIIEKYGMEEGLDKIQTRNNKMRNSIIENGRRLIPKELRFEYLIYSQLVWDETKYSILINGKNKFGIDKIKSDLTIDHMYSIKNGFLDGVSPNIIGHIENINFISKSNNSSKKCRNSIDLDFLIDNINKFENGK